MQRVLYTILIYVADFTQDLFHLFENMRPSQMVRLPRRRIPDQFLDISNVIPSLLKLSNG